MVKFSLRQDCIDINIDDTRNQKKGKIFKSKIFSCYHETLNDLWILTSTFSYRN